MGDRLHQDRCLDRHNLPQSFRPLNKLTKRLKFFTRTAGGSPEMSTARCDDLPKKAIIDVVFALRAHGRRAACGPSQELESLLITSRRKLFPAVNLRPKFSATVCPMSASDPRVPRSTPCRALFP